MIEWVKLHGIRIAIIFIIGIAVYIVLRSIVPRLISRTITTHMKNKPTIEIKKRRRTLIRVIGNTIGVVLAVLVLFTILAEIGVNIGPALASLGIIGLAFGFAAQSMIKDLINGLFILLENYYGIGDVVKVAGIIGLVEEINLRRTILRDLDGVVHYIPNSEITVASNYTKEFSRVNMNVPVAYKENLDHVFSVINKVCDDMAKESKWQDIFIKPPQVLRIDNLGDSGIEIKILGDTQPSCQWEAMGELRKRIKQAFDEAGIEIPWPHMKVFFGNRNPDNET